MNKFNSASTKNLSGSLNSGMDLIDPENSVVGNLVVSAEGPPSKKMKCISPVTMSGNIVSNTNAIATNTNAITTLQTKTVNQASSSGATTFIGDVALTGSISSNGSLTSSSIKTPTGTSSQILLANGTIDSTALTNISTNTTNISTLQTKLNSSQVAIATNAGLTSQGVSCVAIGQNCGQNTQSDYAVSVGLNAGQNIQGTYSVAIGLNSAQTSQGQGCVAIGLNSGQFYQGNNSVAIGSYAAQTNQSNNSIVINGTGSPFLDTTYRTQQGLFINPVRNDNSGNSNTVCYNTTSKELTYTSQDITYWRYQAAGYNGTIPTTYGVDGPFFMAHLGNSLAVGLPLDTSTKVRKYRVQSQITTPGNGAVAGWLGLSTMPAIFVRQGFKVVLGFSVNDSTTLSAGPTRTMIGLIQTTTAPVLNFTTAVSSVTTQSMGIIQEIGESVWSFNTRGSTASTKVASTISCVTPTSTWYVLEMINYVNSDDIKMTLTDQDGVGSAGQATQTFTCGTSSTLATTGQCYIQLQRNMATPGGVAGSAVLQTASFRLWQAN